MAVTNRRFRGDGVVAMKKAGASPTMEAVVATAAPQKAVAYKSLGVDWVAQTAEPWRICCAWLNWVRSSQPALEAG